MKKEALQSDKMRHTSIGKLLLQMSLPAIFSMLVQALYNVVDSLFVANITESIFAGNYTGPITSLGDDSMTAINIIFPMTTFVTAIAVGIGVGANAYIARKLGEGNREKASQAAKTAVVMVLCAWAVLFVLAFTITKPFVSIFVNENNVADINYVTDQAVLYVTMYMACSIGQLLDIVFARILQATGNMKVPMISQLIGALSNIALDALFILVFKWGVLGAILATVIGQWLAAIFNICMFVFKKQDVSVSLVGFKFVGKDFGRILRIGMPAFVMNAIGAFITILLNFLMRNENSGIFVLGTYFKVQSFIFMPVFGLMQGTMPILSYNYGANQKKRFNQTFSLALKIAIGVMVVGTLIFQLLPNQILGAFTQDTQKIQDGAYAFRVISIAFIPAAFSILIVNMLQSLNKPVSSLLMSLSRQLLFLIPTAILFYNLWQLNGIWFCYPIAEIMSVLVYSPFAVKDYKKQFAYKEQQYANHELTMQP